MIRIIYEYTKSTSENNLFKLIVHNLVTRHARLEINKYILHYYFYLGYYTLTQYCEHDSSARTNYYLTGVTNVAKLQPTELVISRISLF